MNDKCKKLRSVVTVDLALCCSQFYWPFNYKCMPNESVSSTFGV